MNRTDHRWIQQFEQLTPKIINQIRLSKLQMGKKIRYQLLKGSFIEPMFQFTNKVQIGINPINDPKGAKVGTYLHNLAKNIRPKFKGEGFQTTLDYDMTSSSSYVIFHYLNGWKQGFHLKNTDLNTMFMNHENITRVVQLQRALEGFEEEYEDEEKK